MDEQLFIQTINTKAKELGINPLLLISGIEGLYSFRDVELNAINYHALPRARSPLYVPRA